MASKASGVAAAGPRPTPESPAATAPAPQRAIAARRAGGSRQVVLGALALVAGVGGTAYYLAHRGVESTDDAQLDSDVIAVPSRIAGVVTAIHFSDNQTLQAGALLAEIDARSFEAKLAEAEADLASAQASSDAAAVEARLAVTNARGQHAVARASLVGARESVSATTQQIAEAEAAVNAATATWRKTRIDLDRARELVSSSAVPQSQLDAAQAAFDAAQAQVAQASARKGGLSASSAQAVAKVSEAAARLDEAATVPQQIADARARAKVAEARVATARALRDLAALDLSYTRIYAPRDGVVSKRAINVGQMVSAGAPIVSLIPTAALWVTANFKETQMERMRIGQPAEIRVDAYGGRRLHGEVESFSGATGARFSLLPPDNATGNYTKVVQRLPVRIKLREVPAELALRPGLSVDVAVDTLK